MISGYDMAAEAALAKLSFLLGCGLPTEEVRRRMSVDVCGELTPTEGYVCG